MALGNSRLPLRLLCRAASLAAHLGGQAGQEPECIDERGVSTVDAERQGTTAVASRRPSAAPTSVVSSVLKPSFR